MKILATIFATILLVLGVLSWMTPIPGGTPAIALGLAILICTSKTAARVLSNWRTRFAALNKVLTLIEDNVPARLGDALRRTRPSVD